MSPMYTSHVSYIYESCLLCIRVMSPMYMSHVSYVYESCLLCIRVMSIMYTSHVSYVYESYLLCIRVMSPMYTSHASYVYESCLLCIRVMSPTYTSHVSYVYGHASYVYESCLLCIRVMSLLFLLCIRVMSPIYYTHQPIKNVRRAFKETFKIVRRLHEFSKDSAIVNFPSHFQRRLNFQNFIFHIAHFTFRLSYFILSNRCQKFSKVSAIVKSNSKRLLFLINFHFLNDMIERCRQSI